MIKCYTFLIEMLYLYVKSLLPYVMEAMGENGLIRAE